MRQTVHMQHYQIIIIFISHRPMSQLHLAYDIPPHFISQQLQLTNLAYIKMLAIRIIAFLSPFLPKDTFPN